MSNRFLGIFTFIIITGLITATGRAKPPDLPENFIITVQPIYCVPSEFQVITNPGDANEFATLAKSVQDWFTKAYEFASKFDFKTTIKAKSIVADGLLKAAHLEMVEGRSSKAAELVRQAHAISPERVEADPLVYKMHLLDEQPVLRGGEEASEPARPLPIHPRQHIKPKKS